MPIFAPTSAAFDIYIAFASDKGDNSKFHIAEYYVINYFMQLIVYMTNYKWSQAFVTDMANTPF